MNNRPLSLCRSLERVVGLAAVSAEWRHELAQDWKWAQSLLRPTTRLADCYPKLNGGPASHAAYRVVWHDEAADRYVAACPDGTGRLELCREDLIVHELDTRELARRLAEAMRLVCDYGEVAGAPYATRIGARDPLTDDESWVYVALQVGPQTLIETLTGLSVLSDRPFVLLTPTRAAWRPWFEGRPSRASVIAIDEAFVVAEDGSWSLISSHLPTAHSSRGAARLSKGATSSPTLPPPGYIPDRNEMVVLRVLAGATALMIQDEIVAATTEGVRPLSRRTVGKVLASLTGRGLVEYPFGKRKGVKVTTDGRGLIASAAGGSH